MNEELFTGKLVRLRPVDPESMAQAYGRWSQDSLYWRLMSGEPAHPMPPKTTREWLEGELFKDPPGFCMFAIHTLADDRLIGEIGFEEDGLPPGEVFVAVGIGDREDWGKGYGTEAMRLALGYAFTELNLRRVSLTVFEQNARAIRSYQKAGFIEEGCQRGCEQRAGQRYNLVFMGILRQEWLDQQAQHQPMSQEGTRA